MILWMGDSVSHDMHNIQEQDVIKSIDLITDLIKKYYPQTPLVVTLGNHDFEPANYQ